MIVTFLSLLLLQSCFADDNKECKKKFGKNYEALPIVAGACKYMDSCLKCTKGHRMHADQYCSPEIVIQSKRKRSLDEDVDACHRELGANYTTMYPGACLFNRCYLCLNEGDIGFADGAPACVPPAPAPQSRKRRRRSVTTSSPAVVQQQSATEAPTTTAATNTLSRAASAPPHHPPYPYPQPPLYPPPRALYPPPPPHYGYRPQPLGGLFSDPMLLLFLSGELGGSSSDNTFSKLIALSQFGNLGGHGLQGIPPSSLALSGIGGFGQDPASLALTGYLSPSSGIAPSSLYLQSYLRNH